MRGLSMHIVNPDKPNRPSHPYQYGAASDLGLHCLQTSRQRNVRLIRIEIHSVEVLDYCVQLMSILFYFIYFN